MKPVENPRVLRVTVGLSLLAFIDSNQDSPLIKCVSPIRKFISERFGILIPGVHFSDDLSSQPTQYNFYHRQQLLDQAVLEPGCSLLVSATGIPTQMRLNTSIPPQIAGLFPCRECAWIPLGEVAQANLHSGVVVLSPIQIIEKHLRQTLIQHTPHLLSFEEMVLMLDRSPLTATKAALAARGFDAVEIWKLFRILLLNRFSLGHIDQRLEQLLLHVKPEDKNHLVKLAERLQVEMQQQQTVVNGVMRYN